MSGSASRIIALMEAFETSGDGSMTAQELVERSGLPLSTGYRIISELQDLGLVHRGPDRKLLPNFTFQRRLMSPYVDIEYLATACKALSESLNSAAEVVILNGQNLLWHIVEQHPDQEIRLRAHSGFLRSTHELDSISRLALAHLSLADIEKRWDTSAFFSTGLDRQPMSWEDVRDALQAVDTNEVQLDMMGNAKGIRRFAVAIHGSEGELACLLTVAEAAIPVRNEAAHVAALHESLLTQKSLIEGYQMKLTASG